MLKNHCRPIYLLLVLLLAGCQIGAKNPTPVPPTDIPTPIPVQPMVAGAIKTNDAVEQSLQFDWEIGSCGSGDNQFNQPHGVAFDSNSSAYVADSGNHRIVKLDPDGKWNASWGEQGSGPGQLGDPADLSVASDGTIFVLDSENAKVVQFSPDGQFIKEIGVGLGLYGPRGLTVDSQDHIWIADTGGARLLELNADGSPISIPGGNEQGINVQGQPTDVAIGANGMIWIADADSGVIWSLKRNGTVFNTFQITRGDSTDSPHLAIGPDNEVVATDTSGNRILTIPPNGGKLHQTNINGTNTGQYSLAVGIGTDKANGVAIADPASCKIIKYSLP